MHLYKNYNANFAPFCIVGCMTINHPGAFFGVAATPRDLQRNRIYRSLSLLIKIKYLNRAIKQFYIYVMHGCIFPKLGKQKHNALL